MKRLVSVVCLFLIMGLSWGVGAYDEGDLEKLKATNECMECDLSGADLTWTELSEANLGGANLSGANLSRSNLTNGNLSGADLSGAFMRMSILTGADLSGADLSGADFTKADLTGAKLTDISIDESAIATNDELKELMLKQADAINTLYRQTNDKYIEGNKKWFTDGDESINVKYVGEIIEGVPHGIGAETISFGVHKGQKYVGQFKAGKYQGQGTWTRADGSKYVGQLKEGKLHGHGTFTFHDGRKFVGYYKDGSPWDGIGYDNSNKIAGNFSSGKWCAGCVPTQADLDRRLKRNFDRLFETKSCRECNLTKADLSDANLTGADLTGANLTKADLSDANLTGADLTGANLTKADLSDANLAGANLTGANLTIANLSKANLTRANLNGATLSAARLGNSILDGASFDDAKVNLSEARYIIEEAINRIKKARKEFTKTNFVPDDALRHRAIAMQLLIVASGSGSKDATQLLLLLENNRSPLIVINSRIDHVLGRSFDHEIEFTDDVQWPLHLGWISDLLGNHHEIEMVKGPVFLTITGINSKEVGGAAKLLIREDEAPVGLYEITFLVTDNLAGGRRKEVILELKAPTIIHSGHGFKLEGEEMDSPSECMDALKKGVLLRLADSTEKGLAAVREEEYFYYKSNLYSFGISKIPWKKYNKYFTCTKVHINQDISDIEPFTLTVETPVD